MKYTVLMKDNGIDVTTKDIELSDEVMKSFDNVSGLPVFSLDESIIKDKIPVERYNNINRVNVKYQKRLDELGIDYEKKSIIDFDFLSVDDECLEHDEFFYNVVYDTLANNGKIFSLIHKKADKIVNRIFTLQVLKNVKVYALNISGDSNDLRELSLLLNMNLDNQLSQGLVNTSVLKLLQRLEAKSDDFNKITIEVNIGV